jgi:2-dehydro-3-deoxyglucarate aldolase/4-hydroxy-2-oxoheptanedioate aldolase
MKQHSIKSLLDKGDLVRVMSVGAFPSPKLIEIVGLTGDYHGIWIDQEHAYVSHEQMELLLLACRATGMDAFARVPPTDYATLMRPMETGCSGVMIAQVRSVAQVEQALQWVKYPPRGVRGLFLGNAECGYATVSAAEQVRCADQERWLAVQIETVEAIECVDELADMDGVDMLFVGPADLSCALGVPGDLLHEKCLDALRRVSAACRRTGTPWGTLSRTRQHAECCRDLGCRLFSIAGDLDLIRRGLTATQEAFGDLLV